MCFPGGGSQPVDNSAAIAREQEQARKARITQGQGAIDSAFSVFDPAYYDKFGKTFTDNYNPQVDQQYGLAKQDLRYNFARQGTLNSTPAQVKFGQLLGSYGKARNEVASNAISATNDLRSRVSGNKTALYGQNINAADPSLAASGAAGSVASLQSPGAYSPLADLFTGMANAGTSYVAGRQNAFAPGYSQFFQPGYSTASTSRVVR